MAQYDPKKVIMTYAGRQVNIGTAPGTHIAVERANDLVGMTVGSDGEYVASINQDRSGTATLTLLGTSQLNDVLSAQVALTEAGGFGGAPLEIADLNGRTLCFAREAWLQRPANISFGQEGGDMNREWVFVCGQLDIRVGGALIP